jgi:phage pi2 protein 07
MAWKDEWTEPFERAKATYLAADYIYTQSEEWHIFTKPDGRTSKMMNKSSGGWIHQSQDDMLKWKEMYSEMMEKVGGTQEPV